MKNYDFWIILQIFNGSFVNVSLTPHLDRKSLFESS